MKTRIENNKVISYYQDFDSYIIGAVKTYVSIQNKFYQNKIKIDAAITMYGKLPENLFFLVDKKEMYIKSLKRIENVYCLKPF